MIKVQVGDKFNATIDGEKNIEGSIQIDSGNVYLCQNVCNGDSCKDRLGYEYSWYVSTVGNFNYNVLVKELVKDFQLLPNRKSRIENLNI